jgi:hypothetical protein
VKVLMVLVVLEVMPMVMEELEVLVGEMLQ